MSVIILPSVQVMCGTHHNKQNICIFRRHVIFLQNIKLNSFSLPPLSSIRIFMDHSVQKFENLRLILFCCLCEDSSLVLIKPELTSFGHHFALSVLSMASGALGKENGVLLIMSI